jgi:predicted nucleic acid-binding protein
MSYLVDTNILLRSSDPHHAMHSDAVTALKKLRQRQETLYITS